LRSISILVGDGEFIVMTLFSADCEKKVCDLKMKFPKETKRYCPHCKKHTLQKIDIAKQKSRGTAHPLSWGSESRAIMRGARSGTGNKGRWGSKPPIKKWKRKTKVTRRLVIMYKCKECNKSKGMKSSIRTSRLEIGDKVAK
jgi:large subunit ribosomal protein L44e